MCRGCNKDIGHTQTCLTCRCKMTENDNFLTNIKCHASPSCLKKMGMKHKELFMKHPWTNQEVISAKNELTKGSKK